MALIYLLPGDPAVALLGPQTTPEQIARLRAQMGLDRPLPVQYVLWLTRIAHGDLGTSSLNNMPVRALLARRIPVTLHLAIATMVVAPAIGIPLGIALAVRQSAWTTRVIVTYNTFAMAVPTFWLGILLVLFFGLQLRWLPTSGFVPFLDSPLRSVRFLILPTITLST